MSSVHVGPVACVQSAASRPTPGTAAMYEGCGIAVARAHGSLSAQVFEGIPYYLRQARPLPGAKFRAPRHGEAQTPGSAPLLLARPQGAEPHPQLPSPQGRNLPNTARGSFTNIFALDQISKWRNGLCFSSLTNQRTLAVRSLFGRPRHGIVAAFRKDRDSN